MRLIITFLMAWCLSWGAYAATAPDSKQISQELEQAKAAKPAQPEVVEALQSALNALEERKGSLERIKQYQEVIDNYPKLSATLRAQLNNMRDEPRSVSPGMSTDALNQEILQVSSQLLDKSRQAQQEQERAREIADSLNQLPQQQTDARRQLNEIERRLGTLTGNSPLNQAQNFALQSDSARLKALVDELELAILQHLDLTPGTGYAITTITKYLLMLIGGLVGFSMIGIEWSKLQWLVAALGVGLGFGLQEIFANFISGLIILFEKPIRIGDTVTIRDLTGSVTKINTRATTISDWDRKEIIVPNKAFITEQFINWSLSDSVTRVVLTIPAPADANSEEVTEILLTAARRCSLVIDNPAPEVFLVDLQQGIQIFELRIYAAEMGHRMPLRHEIHQLILAGFHAHGIDMPFPPFQMRLESLNGKQTGRTLTSAGKGRQAGSL